MAIVVLLLTILLVMKSWLLIKIMVAYKDMGASRHCHMPEMTCIRLMGLNIYAALIAFDNRGDTSIGMGTMPDCCWRTLSW